jgi:hypothetical protein
MWPVRIPATRPADTGTRWGPATSRSISRGSAPPRVPSRSITKSWACRGLSREGLVSVSSRCTGDRPLNRWPGIWSRALRLHPGNAATAKQQLWPRRQDSGTAYSYQNRARRRECGEGTGRRYEAEQAGKPRLLRPAVARHLGHLLPRDEGLDAGGDRVDKRPQCFPEHAGSRVERFADLFQVDLLTRPFRNTRSRQRAVRPVVRSPRT